MKNDILHIEITEQIDAQENVDHALGGIPTGWLKPAFITTEQIDTQENVGMVPNSPDEPMIILDPEGFTTPVELEWVDPNWTIDPVTGSDIWVDPNWTIDPVTGSYIDYLIYEPMINLDSEGFTAPVALEWVDPNWTIDPVTGLISHPNFNKNDLLHLEIEGLPNEPMIMVDPAGFTNVPKIAIDPAGFTTPFGLGWVDPSWTIDPVTGSYIDDPISGMIDSIGEKPSLYIDPNFDKNDLLHLEIEGLPNEPMIMVDPAGFTTPFGLGWVDPSWTIDPVTGSYIDDPISGMIDSIGEKPSLTMGRIPDSWLRSQSLNTTDLPISMNIVSTKGSTAGNDILTGTASNDRLSGLAGNDTLDGALGNDVLNGGVGNDVLMGGIGKDKLTGGAGADTFKFASSNESTFWSMDTITDFKNAQGDKIDLSAIDSNANLAGDQGFTLVSSFSADATGQLYFDAKTDILFGSTDADSAPEFAITLNGVNTLLPADFIF